MAYAQKDYSQIQGIDGRYKISSIGCFVTAFCNLEEGYGKDINPFSLNNEFVASGIYIDVDDDIRDDLGWSSISQYDPSVVVTGSVDHGTAPNAGWPTTNEAIVRFYYRSITNPTLANGQPNMIFHFCKVADANNHTIIDSWDGLVKTSPYGEPTAYATYAHTAPVPVAAPPPLLYTLEDIAPKQVQIKQDTGIYNIDIANFDDMTAHPVVGAVKDQIWTVQVLVHHNNGYQYYLQDRDNHAGFNTLDCDDYTPPPPRPPDAPMSIPTSTEPYTVVKTILGYATSNDAANDLNAKTTVEAGKYYIFNRRYSPTKADELIALNVTTTPGKSGSWINPDKNVEDTPEPSPVNALVAEKERMVANRGPASEPAEETTPIPVVVKPPNPHAWKKLHPLNDDLMPELYISMNKSDLKLRDLDQRLSPLVLEPLKPLHIVGYIIKDGTKYGVTQEMALEGVHFALPWTILELAEYKGIRVTDYLTLIKHKLSKLIQDVRS